METVKFKLPTEYYNQINNFYLEHFGYDIYTQLQNFIMGELGNCSDSPISNPYEHPHPSIGVNNKDSGMKYRFIVEYPDKSTLQVFHEDYHVLVNVWNEWSKYQFAKDAKEKVLLKCIPGRVQNINMVRGKYAVRKYIDGKKIMFGLYDSVDDAYLVKCFLEEHDWDFKYHHINLISSFDGCNINNYSDYLLRIVRGECEL